MEQMTPGGSGGSASDHPTQFGQLHDLRDSTLGDVPNQFRSNSKYTESDLDSQMFQLIQNTNDQPHATDLTQVGLDLPDYSQVGLPTEPENYQNPEFEALNSSMEQMQRMSQSGQQVTDSTIFGDVHDFSMDQFQDGFGSQHGMKIGESSGYTENDLDSQMQMLQFSVNSGGIDIDDFNFEGQQQINHVDQQQSNHQDQSSSSSQFLDSQFNELDISEYETTQFNAPTSSEPTTQGFESSFDPGQFDTSDFQDLEEQLDPQPAGTSFLSLSLLSTFIPFQ